jgi:hypothetical protein
MASVAVEIYTRATPSVAWDAIRDIGALHTRLVPGWYLGSSPQPHWCPAVGE